MRLHRPPLATLAAGLFAALLSASLYANTDVDFTATVQKDTCKIEVDGNGTVTFATVGPAWFADGITAETDYSGGKEFTIKLISCPVSDGKITNVTFDFVPQSGQFAENNKQVFANELAVNAGGASNVGVVIFTTRSPRTNVLNIDGTSRATFSPGTYSGTDWVFYARMQKVLEGEAVGTGKLASRVLVNVRYE